MGAQDDTVSANIGFFCNSLEYFVRYFDAYMDLMVSSLNILGEYHNNDEFCKTVEVPDIKNRTVAGFASYVQSEKRQ